jgi:hypothetical protein
MVSISLNDLDKYLDKAKSQFMSFDYKNLDREKKRILRVFKSMSQH